MLLLAVVLLAAVSLLFEVASGTASTAVNDATAANADDAMADNDDDGDGNDDEDDDDASI